MSGKHTDHPGHGKTHPRHKATKSPEFAKRGTYAVLDSQGHLIPEESRHPYELHEPASTTKMWSYYTMLTMIKHGQLPESFFDQPYSKKADPENHGTWDIARMLVSSDDHAALRLAAAAGKHLPGHGSPTAKFCHYMTRLAHAKGLHDSSFTRADGMPMLAPTAHGVTNISTAHDVARMAYLLEHDFPKATYRLGAQYAHNTNLYITGRTAFKHGIDFGKTGTGGSEAPPGDPKGALAYAGGENGHYFAVLDATRRDRNHVIKEVANRYGGPDHAKPAAGHKAKTCVTHPADSHIKVDGNDTLTSLATFIHDKRHTDASIAEIVAALKKANPKDTKGGVVHAGDDLFVPGEILASRHGCKPRGRSHQH